MEVILLQDIEPLGHEGDIVRVADGHARNYLLPRKLAVEATKAARKELARRQRAIQAREAQKAEAARATVERLHQQPLTIVAKSGAGGRLHGTVTAQQIADALAEQTGVSLDRRRITLLEPIRELGDYLVSAEIYKGITAQLTIRVISQEQAAKDDAPKPEANRD